MSHADRDSLVPAQKSRGRALLVGLVLVLLGASRSCGEALSQEPSLDALVTADAERLAVAVARTCAHEAGFASPADCSLIVQATRRHGDTPGERLAWLARHSDGALTGAHWSASLPLGVDEQAPAGWPTDVDWTRYAPRWQRLREYVRGLVVEGHTPRGGWPCERDPDTWAGRRVDAAHVAEHAAQLEPMSCRDPRTGAPTLNEGYRWRRAGAQ